MSSDDSRIGMCEAYGCPLFASVGDGGKWVCCCHYGRNGATNDAVTAVLKANMHIVNAVRDIRQFGYTDDWATVRSGIAKAFREANRLDLLPGEADCLGDKRTPEKRAWLGRLERTLIHLTAGTGEQLRLPATVPTAHVVGPTHATEHFSEQASRLVEQA